MRARLLALLGVLGCSEPPFVTVEIVEGQGERVSELNGPRLDASFVLQVTSPPGAEPTQLLLQDMQGFYRYPNPCQPQPVLLNLSPDQSFPMRIEPGSEQRATFTVGAADPIIANCRVPDVLELRGHYYDSVKYEYQHEEYTPLHGEIAMELDPNLSGPSDYSCIGKVPQPPYGSGNSKGFVWLRAYESGDVVPGVAVKSCAISDAGCEAPIDQGTTDIVGVWPLAVPNSSPWFYDVGPVAGFAPALFFEYFPPEASGFERILTPVADGELAAILSAMSVTAEAGHGHVAVRILDCVGGPAIGLKVAAASGTPTVGYWKDGTLDATAESTTVDGFAFMLNLPAGTATVEARLAISNDFVGSRVLHVREGAVSFVVIDPTPTR